MVGHDDDDEWGLLGGNARLSDSHLFTAEPKKLAGDEVNHPEPKPTAYLARRVFPLAKELALVISNYSVFPLGQIAGLWQRIVFTPYVSTQAIIKPA